MSRLNGQVEVNRGLDGVGACGATDCGACSISVVVRRA